MVIRTVVWLPTVVDKLAWKHHLLPAEVAEVFLDAPVFRKIQTGYYLGEHLYAGLGRTGAGRFVIVFFLYKRNRDALIVSARDMDAKERRRYARK